MDENVRFSQGTGVPMAKFKSTAEKHADLDWAKFKTVVHYICFKCHDPSVLGATKLNKVLWHSDVLAYKERGQVITGEKYIKHQYGPFSPHLEEAVSELVQEKAIIVRDAEFFDLTKKEYIALKKPDISSLKAEEVSWIEDMINYVCHKNTARSISKSTHDDIWEMAVIGEELPPYTVFCATLGEITEKDVAWAKKHLARA